MVEANAVVNVKLLGADGNFDRFLTFVFDVCTVFSLSESIKETPTE